MKDCLLTYFYVCCEMLSIEPSVTGKMFVNGCLRKWYFFTHKQNNKRIILSWPHLIMLMILLATALFMVLIIDIGVNDSKAIFHMPSCFETLILYLNNTKLLTHSYKSSDSLIRVAWRKKERKKNPSKCG